MSETLSGDVLTERDLCDATGITRYALRRARRWLFIQPNRTFPGRGSVSYYPRSVVPMIRRFSETLRRTQSHDESVWTTWLDDFSFDIVQWADARLASAESHLASVEDGTDLHSVVVARSSDTPTRTDPRRTITGRLGHREEISILMWALDVAAGNEPAKSLYDPASPSLNALKKAAGLSGEWKPPDPALLVENFSLARMRAILGDASIAEMEQSRRDWKKIGEMVAASDRVDWHAVRKALNVQRTSSAQPPAPVDFLIALWRDFDARAVLLPFLISVRRSPVRSDNQDDSARQSG